AITSGGGDTGGEGDLDILRDDDGNSDGGGVADVDRRTNGVRTIDV
nr:hypothetical protein [Tanacetum cinerariifolium]